MADAGWDEVTVLRKRTPRASQMRSQQVILLTILLVTISPRNFHRHTRLSVAPLVDTGLFVLQTW